MPYYNYAIKKYIYMKEKKNMKKNIKITSFKNF